jgi:hypothetical protein
MADFQAAGDLKRYENYHSYNQLSKRATDVNRIASDDYYRVNKDYNHIKHQSAYKTRDYYSNYKKQKRPQSSKPRPRFTVPFPNHEWLKNKDLGKVNKKIMKGEIGSFKEFASKIDVQLPNSTLYTIDKAVRDRLRKGRYGVDFSEYINLESEEEHKYHFYHHEMLKSGKTSIQVPFVPHSVLLQDKLVKSPMLQENKQTKSPSIFKSIRGLMKTTQAKATKKYGSVRKGHGTAKEEYADWRMRKRATNRLKDKLIEQAKTEVRNQLYHDMLRVTQMIRPSDANTQNDDDHEAEKENQRYERARAYADADDESLEQHKLEFVNFRDFCLRTTGKIYPNPVF